jgi:putative hemolysin
MNEFNHNQQNVNLNISTAALLRNKFLAFGKNAIEFFPLDLSSFSPFPAKPGQRVFQPVAEPQDAALLVQEVERLPLEQRLFNNADYAVFYAKAWQMPRLMDEIGRLREMTFRKVGEGTGKTIDVDVFDTYYEQLFVWHKTNQEVVGAYRMGKTDDILKTFGKKGLYTSTLFKFKKSLFEKMSPALELGRSFVQPEYQRTPFALFLLWKGIGQYLLRHPQYKTLFGPVSISNEYSALSRQLMVEYMKENCCATELARLVKPRNPFPLKSAKPWHSVTANPIFHSLEELSCFIAGIESEHQGVPVLLKQYLKLGARVMGFNIDEDFCDSLDGLIVVDLMMADRRMLEKLMGEECATTFFSEHSNKKATSISC